MRYTQVAAVLLCISAVLVVASCVVIVKPGPMLSIEFTGGTLLEVELPEGKTKDDLTAAITEFPGISAQSVSVTATQTDSFFIRLPTLTNEQHLALLKYFGEHVGPIQELQFTTIGPTVGSNLKRRALWALAVASIAIVLYVAVAFRKIPRTMSPWSFGIAAIIALIHDVILTLGIFTILSHRTTFQVDTLFVSALLSIMGYSVSDTIVIFDRIRDNLFLEGNRKNFADIATQSLKQSLSRTLNTGLGALIMLFALFFFGAESIRWFILALILGTIIGTYSSFFIATPLLIFWRRNTGR